MAYTKNTQTTWETCPISGLRERRSDCVLGRESRKEYDDTVEQTLANGGQIIDMFVLAETEGEKTLERLKEKWHEVATEKTNRHKFLFNRAEIQLQANLSSQKSAGAYHVTDGIRHRAKMQIFEKMRSEDEECQKLSIKIHGLKKAVGSLQKYLDFDLPRMREDCEEKRAAERQKIGTSVA